MPQGRAARRRLPPDSTVALAHRPARPEADRIRESRDASTTTPSESA
jgi:hypothetical protein